MSANPIPVMLPRLPEPGRVAARLQQVQDSRHYSNFGPQVRELEERYANFLGTSADRVVSVTNATLGIEGAVAVTDAKNWAVPAFTFAATPAAVLGAGRTLHWSDISADDWWLDVDSTRLDAESSAVAVAPFGTGFKLSRWPETWQTRELVIDAAASLGAALPSLRDLPPTWTVVFSLHATKVLPAGEGGIVVFGDASRAREFRAWSNFGFDGRRESMRVGTNAKMSEVAAAFANCSLDGWEQERNEWEQAHSRARQVEAELGLHTVPQVTDQLSPYWIIAFESKDQAERVKTVLEVHGIGTRRWWFPACHTMRGFRQIMAPPLPNTDVIAPRVLGLPMFRELRAADFDRIASVLELALEKWLPDSPAT